MYVSRILTHRDHAHEVISYDLSGWLGNRWRRLHDERLAQLRRLVRRRLWLAVLISLGITSSPSAQWPSSPSCWSEARPVR